MKKNTRKNKIAKKGDVLVSFDGTVGRIGIGISGAYSTGIRKVYDKDNEISNALIYFIFKDNSIQETIRKYATGSNILHAGGSIEHLKIPYDTEIYLKFEEKVKIIFEQILLNKEQNQELIKLRDFMLPLLMNGRVTIED